MAFEIRMKEIGDVLNDLTTYNDRLCDELKEYKNRTYDCAIEIEAPKIENTEIKNLDDECSSINDYASIHPIFDYENSVPSFVEPDLINGFESGSIKLARDFYEYFVFSQISQNIDVQNNLRNVLFSCDTRKKLKNLFINGKRESIWITRKNKKISRNFNQVLYTLSNYFKVCKVIKNKKIIWTRVTKKNNDYKVDSEYISLLMDFVETKLHAAFGSKRLNNRSNNFSI